MKIEGIATDPSAGFAYEIWDVANNKSTRTYSNNPQILGRIARSVSEKRHRKFVVSRRGTGGEPVRWG